MTESTSSGCNPSSAGVHHRARRDRRADGRDGVIFLIVAVLAFGILFLRLHTLPERMAHKSHKLQFEIVAVLGLLALFTHMHIFWVAGLLLAMIDLPDFGTPLSRIAGSAEKIAGHRAGRGRGRARLPRDAADRRWTCRARRTPASRRRHAAEAGHRRRSRRS